MVYAQDLKSCSRKGLWVQLPPPAPVSKLYRFDGVTPAEEREHVKPGLTLLRGGVNCKQTYY